MTDGAKRARMLQHLAPYIERARSFSGWGFSDIRIKHLEPEPPWDYEALVREHASRARSMIDLGTGGGEFYSTIVAGSKARAVATEEWHVNAPVARDRLAPLGARVVRASADHAMPFADASFDLIIDRHEALNPPEVARTLGPGGTVITQQVNNGNWQEVHRWFPRRPDFGDHFTRYQEGFRAAGLSVEAQSHEWRVAYETIGDFVFMLLVAPWEVPGFDPVAELDDVIAMEEGLRTADGIVVTFARYLIVARRPA